MTTTIVPTSRTMALDGTPTRRCPDEILEKYHALVDQPKLSRTEHLRLERRLGSGGQGVVFLSERRGTDSFTLPVALKIFSPERYVDTRSYEEAMGRIAAVAGRVAQIQQDNLLDVYNFIERDRIRMMEMEWIDGYDLQRLLTPEMLKRVKNRVSQRRWEEMNQVVVTAGPIQPRLKPGIAVAIARECLAALAALHREEIVHGDVKPSNIMLKCTGNAKLIDIGSAIDLNSMPQQRTCTPQYAAPEVLENVQCTPRSDLASLGYVLIEMLAGRPLFAGIRDYGQLLEAKRLLPQQIESLMPPEAACNEMLMNFCRSLTAADPMCRFPNAEAADLVKEGAADFHRQLVKGDLASEYGNEIRVWLEELE